MRGGLVWSSAQAGTILEFLPQLHKSEKAVISDFPGSCLRVNDPIENSTMLREKRDKKEDARAGARTLDR